MPRIRKPATRCLISVFTAAALMASLVQSAAADGWSQVGRGEVYVPTDLLELPEIDAALRERLGDAYERFLDVVDREQNFDPNEENLALGIVTGLSWSPDRSFPAQVTRIDVGARTVHVVLFDETGQAEYFPPRSEWPSDALDFVALIADNLQRP